MARRLGATSRRTHGEPCRTLARRPGTCWSDVADRARDPRGQRHRSMCAPGARVYGGHAWPPWSVGAGCDDGRTHGPSFAVLCPGDRRNLCAVVLDDDAAVVRRVEHHVLAY